MTVLDAQAVIALLLGEPAATEVAALLRDPQQPASVSALNVGEVMDVLIRITGRTADEVAEKLDWLIAGGLRVVAVDEDLARVAGRLHAEHYHRRDRPLSLADCVALATAVRLGEPLATSDPPLAATASATGCRVLPLPDSLGQRPG